MIPLAHALVGREDLPIPAWLFAWGASLVLIVSFAVLAVAWTAPRFERERWRPVPAWLSRLVANRITETIAAVVGVALLAVVVWSGLAGTEQPNANFSVTFVFVTFWLGVVLLSVLFGDVLRAFNPWRAIGRSVSGGFRLVAGQQAPAPLRLPESLGCWPAVVALLGFVWLELVYGSQLTRGVLPHDLAVATLVYSAITFAGMALFGVERWIQRGEAFSVYFGMFSRLSAFELRERSLG